MGGMYNWVYKYTYNKGTRVKSDMPIITNINLVNFKYLKFLGCRGDRMKGKGKWLALPALLLLAAIVSAAVVTTIERTITVKEPLEIVLDEEQSSNIDELYAGEWAIFVFDIKNKAPDVGYGLIVDVNGDGKILFVTHATKEGLGVVWQEYADNTDYNGDGDKHDCMLKIPAGIDADDGLTTNVATDPAAEEGDVQVTFTFERVAYEEFGIQDVGE